MAHLVIGSVQPRRTVGAQIRSVELAVGARAERARQRGAAATAEHARRRARHLATGGRTVGVNEGMTADTEVDSARHSARRTMDNR